MKYWLICLFLYLSNALQSQCYLSFQVDSLLEKNNVIEANVLVENVFYKNENAQEIECAVIEKIKIIKYNKNFHELANFVSKAQVYILNDSIKNMLIYEEAFSHLLLKKFDECINYLNFYKPNNLNTNCIIDAMVIICNNHLQKWKISDSLYVLFCKKYSVLNDSINFLYKNNPKLLSIKKGRSLATFLPGAGQFYAGKPLEGITNFLFQALSIYTGIVWWQKDYKLATILLGSYFFTSFNSGGKDRTQHLIEDKNDITISNYNNSLNYLLLKSVNEFVFRNSKIN